MGHKPIPKLIIMLLTMTFFTVSFGAQDTSSAKKGDTAGIKAPAVKVDKQSKTTVKTSVTQKKTGAKDDTLVIVGRVLEIPGKFPPNDLYNYVYVMKYRVMSISRGSYSGQDILIGEYNPLIPRGQIKDKMAPYVKGDVTKFEVGAKHKLVLVKPIEKIWKEAVEDEYIDSDLDKYYAIRTDIAQ